MERSWCSKALIVDFISGSEEDKAVSSVDRRRRAERTKKQLVFETSKGSSVWNLYKLFRLFSAKLRPNVYFV